MQLLTSKKSRMFETLESSNRLLTWNLALYCILACLMLGAFPSDAQTIATTPVLPRQTIKLPNGRAADVPPGPYRPSWQSLKDNYHVPEWIKDAKSGIFIHFGVYTVPAHGSEWYSHHMYTNAAFAKWHTEHFGPPDKFGYKDFIPLFKAEKFDPDGWADLFVKAGAKYVIPTAEHHDGFAMYDSKLTKWNAKNMGPHRDIIGELGAAVRKRGLKFGVSNHRMENWDFLYPTIKMKTDVFDTAYADFYGPPSTAASSKTNWEIGESGNGGRSRCPTEPSLFGRVVSTLSRNCEPI